MSVTTGASKWGRLSKGASSTTFGSIRIKRTCSGGLLYSSDRIIELICTDLPAPVVPATSRCGISAKSATKGSPAMSLPSARVKGLLLPT